MERKMQDNDDLGRLDDVDADSGLDIDKSGQRKRSRLWIIIGITACVVVMLLTVLVVVLNRQPEGMVGTGDDNTPSEAEGEDGSKTSSDYAGKVISTGEGMRWSCNDLLRRQSEHSVPLMITGAVPRHWHEEGEIGLYTSVAGEPSYLWICDWGIGLELEEGLEIAQIVSGNSLALVAITKDTQFYEQNPYANKDDAPGFYIDFLRDQNRDFGMAFISRLSKSSAEYQEIKE